MIGGFGGFDVGNLVLETFVVLLFVAQGMLSCDSRRHK